MPSRPRIYLAGPISGCNGDQLHLWRDGLKRGFGEEFEFVDPTDNLIPEASSHFSVVQADIEAIRSCDAVLAHLWRESVGTAFGLVHAFDATKVVVVSDPNHLNSRMVAFYADAVVRTPEAGLAKIRTFLRLRNHEFHVAKRDGREQAFDRTKIMIALRKACLDAGQSDIAPPRAILARALDELLGMDTDLPEIVSVQEIQDALWRAMADIASDSNSDVDYDAIRRAWEGHSAKGRAARVTFSALAGTIKIHDEPLDVRVQSRGTHSTIWGTRSTPGREASLIFNEVRRVEGIAEVCFGPFENTHSPPNKPHVKLSASKVATLIEGRCYDKGPKGTLQRFQIHVHDAHRRDAILARLRSHLQDRGMMRPSE
jgi:nucleoside 2-deoxyribosyltransferase